MKKRSFLINIFVFIFFFLAGFGLYSNSLKTPFLFDDITRIKNNEDIRLTELSLKNIYKTAFGKGAKSRPVGNISLGLNYYFNGYRVEGYHLVNIFIHVLTALLLFYFIFATLAISMSGNSGPFTITPNAQREIAFFSAMLWLVNPLHIGSITYIVQRFNSLAAMFYMASFLCYIKGRIVQRERESISSGTEKKDREGTAKKGNLSGKSRAKRKEPARFLQKPKHNDLQGSKHVAHYIWFSGALVFWILGLGSKQIVAILPVMVLIYEFFFFQDLNINWLRKNKKIFIGLVIVFGLMAFIFLGSNPWQRIMSLKDFSENQFTYGERVLTQFRVVLYYISLILFPRGSRLNLDYDFPLSHSLFDPVTTLISLIIILAVLFGAGVIARRERLISFCILWYFGNLLIESSVIPLAIIFEHRTYLPSMLIGLMVVILLYRYVKYRLIIWPGLCLVILIFSVWTYQRNELWQDPVKLWSDVIKKSPNKARPYFNLAQIYSEQGKSEKAIELYAHSIKLNPDYAGAHINIGVLLAEKGEEQKALEHYLKAVKLQHYSKEAYTDIAAILSKEGRDSEAVKYYYEALRLEPKNPIILFGLGVSYYKLSKWDDAVEYLSEAIRIDPNNEEFRYYLGRVFEKQGETEQAMDNYHKVLKINPGYFEANLRLGIISARQGNLTAAVAYLRNVLKIKKDHPVANYNLGVFLAQQQRFEEAMEHLKTAIKAKPDFAQAYNVVGVLLVQQGKLEEAVRYFSKAVEIDPEFSAAKQNLESTLKRLGR